jgi:hypothetical protein
MEVHVSCVQEFPDEVEEPFVLDLLAQDENQGLVILCLLLGPSVRESGLLWVMKEAFLPQHV